MSGHVTAIAAGDLSRRQTPRNEQREMHRLSLKLQREVLTGLDTGAVAVHTTSTTGTGNIRVLAESTSRLKRYTRIEA